MGFRGFWSAEYFDVHFSHLRGMLKFNLLLFCLLSQFGPARVLAQTDASSLREQRLLKLEDLRKRKEAVQKRGEVFEKLSTRSKPVVKAANVVVASPWMIPTFSAAGKYLVDPKYFSWDSSIIDLAASFGTTYYLKTGMGAYLFTKTTNTSTCDTVHCMEFIRDCALKVGLPINSRAEDVIASKNSAQCIRQFLELPLDIQSLKREDANLDRLLALFTPHIRQLTCSNNTVQIETTRDDVRKGSFKTKIEFSSPTQVHTIVNETYETVSDRVSFDSSGKADYLLHTAVNDPQQKFTMDEVAKTNLYFWRNNKWPTGSVPTESFRWARNHVFLLDFQSHVEQVKRPRQLTKQEYEQRNGQPHELEYTGKKVNQIYECCQDKVCQSYFAKRTRVAENVRKDAVPKNISPIIAPESTQ